MKSKMYLIRNDYGSSVIWQDHLFTGPDTEEVILPFYQDEARKYVNRILSDFCDNYVFDEVIINVYQAKEKVGFEFYDKRQLRGTVYIGFRESEQIARQEILNAHVPDAKKSLQAIDCVLQKIKKKDYTDSLESPQLTDEQLQNELVILRNFILSQWPAQGQVNVSFQVPVFDTGQSYEEILVEAILKTSRGFLPDKVILYDADEQKSALLHIENEQD